MNQSVYDIKLEWGLNGIETLAPFSDIIIIIDVLSFSTCVDIATSNGAIVFPYKYKDESAKEFAQLINAELASLRRNQNSFSLSPESLISISKGTKLVLPSPNGSTLSLSAKKIPVVCGCLRNAKAIAEYAMTIGKKISLIPAGEQWQEHKNDGAIRFAFEDFIGAGVIISYLKGTLSPESKSALSVFQSFSSNIFEEIKNCISGRELVEKGFEKDVELACELNVSSNVPVLKNNFYVSA
ncbi:MAG TPA: 2-phosphosulfolactate phosphatase [Ignavibacteria bacterium]|nr:2-phosphosulfolactate phosphatase [Ignavibacteria bacterium]